MRKVHGPILAIALGALIATAAVDTMAGAASIEYPEVPQASILASAGNRYPALARALSVVGFRVGRVAPAAYSSLPRGKGELLVVPGPEGQHLDSSLVQAILRNVERGMPLLLDGDSPLAAALGIEGSGSHGQMTRYRWERYAENPVRLPERLTYPRFRPKPALQALALDAKQHAPVVVAGRRGQGRFIYSALPLEPPQGMVFQYLPFLAQAIVDELHIQPSLAAGNLGVYVDAGNDPKIDPAAVAAQLKSWSVHEVHLGAFYSSESFREFVPRFIAAAHLLGIAVYAWVEYPMVSDEFWNRHPQWREVTANGRPAIMDWRYHMALEDPACFRAVADLTRRLVLDNDWDGVDLAELYFEADPGIFRHPREFTPMHPVFRQMFQRRYGVDPIELFNPESPHYGPRNPQLRSELLNFRVELVTQLTEQFLQVLADCRATKPYLQTTLTFIDALRDPSVTGRFGVDPARLLALQKRFGFAVEVEDPYTVWNSTPERYRAMGEHYRARLAAGTPLSIDINVVDRTPPGRPLRKPRGLELYDLLANVAANADMAALYAFATVSPGDMRLVPWVLGAQQMASGPTADGTLRARRQVTWQTDTRGKTVYVDGKEWPCHSDSEVIIPAGAHQVELRPAARRAAGAPIHMESVSATILAARQDGEQVTLTYESRGRCYVALNRKPTRVLCDGAGIDSVLSGDGHVCLELPQGRHTVQVQ